MTLERPLSEIATITMGISPKGNTYNQNAVGLPLLNGPTEFGSMHPNCTLFTTNSLRKCQPGDLIFCVRASTGRMNWADSVYALGRGVCSIRGNSTSDTRFIKYCLDWKLESLLKLASGATFSNLTQDVIRNFEIPFPETRRQIASILSAYDELIENNTRRIKILEEMTQSIYREWFVNYRFPGHQKVKMMDSPLGMIPERWKVTRLGDKCEINMGQSPPSKFYNTQGVGIPFHQGVTHFGTRFPKTSIYCSALNRIAEPKDILLSVRAPVGRLNIADRRIVIGRGLAAIRHKLGWQSYTFEQLKVFFIEEDTIGAGTIFKAVTKQDVYRIPFIEPDMSIVTDFENMVQVVNREIEVLIETNDNLRQTRDLLLPRLISGEIDVTDLDIQVPEELS